VPASHVQASFRKCGLPCGLCRSLPALAGQTRVYASIVSFDLRLLYNCNTRYELLVRLYSPGTSTLEETPSFAWRTNGMAHATTCCRSAAVGLARLFLNYGTFWQTAPVRERRSRCLPAPSPNGCPWCSPASVVWGSKGPLPVPRTLWESRCWAQRLL